MISTRSVRASTIWAAMVSISSGPRPQLAPTAATPAALSAVTASAGRTPIIVRRLVSKLSVATIGRSGTTSRAAAIAASASARSLIVSIRTRSMPPSRSPASCSAKIARASSASMVPSGAISSPVGPRSPATRAPCSFATSRAIRAPASLSSCTRSPRPCMSSRGRVPPKVLVVRMRAPAAAYCRWASRISSARSTFQSSPEPPSSSPMSWRSVPMPPSTTTAPAAASSPSVLVSPRVFWSCCPSATRRA